MAARFQTYLVNRVIGRCLQAWEEKPMRFEIRPLSDALGAEVIGLDVPF